MLLLSGDVQLNPGPAPFINVNATSTIDAYEPFSSPWYSKLRVAILNIRSISNKSAVICDYTIDNMVDVLCISETWINDGEMTNSLLSSLLPSNYCLSQYYGRPKLSYGGGVAIISHNSIHYAAISIPSFSSFECIGSIFTSSTSSSDSLLYINHLLYLLTTFLLNLNRHWNFKLLLILIYFLLEILIFILRI